MKQGWVRLYRQIEENPLWLMEPFTKAQAWVDLFLNANHSEGKICIRGNVVVIKRGQIGWSELTMAKRWSWSKNKVRRFLKYLETEQQIEQQKNRYITTIVTITNYDKYQNDTADDTAERQQKDSRRYINNNVKNVKNVKNNNNVPVGTGTSLSSNWKPEYGDKYINGFNSLFNTHYRLTPSRVTKLKLRFKTYTSDQISMALVTLSKSRFHQGDNDRGWKADPDFLIKSDEQVDKWLNKGGGDERVMGTPEEKEFIARLEGRKEF